MGDVVEAKPNRDLLLDLFSYDQSTGKLTRRKTIASNARAGDVPGYIHRGYRCVGVRGGQYRATSLIWLMMTGEWPPCEIDHRDTYGPKADWGDRWENLRLATRQQNKRNSRRRDSASGHPGVTRKRARWRACIGIGVGKRIYLGYFANLEDAVAVRRAAELEHFGEYAPMVGAAR